MNKMEKAGEAVGKICILIGCILFIFAIVVNLIKALIHALS